MSETRYRKPSPALLARINAHDEWVKTDGRAGKQLTSTGDFSGLDLQGSNLERANLSTADFYRANLRRANLIGADLSGARLVETDLRNANMQKANLVLAFLIGADIRGARFEKARTEFTVWPSPRNDPSRAIREMDAHTHKRQSAPSL